MGEGVSTIARGNRARGMNTVNERSFGRAVRKWAQMTDENRHGEVRQSIAKYFKYEDLENEYKEINKEHNRAGYLSRELYDRRFANDDKLYKRIRKEYGEGVLNRVYSGL